MIVEIAKWVVIIFGIFIIFVGFVMLIKPEIARNTVRKAGSTNLINYGEITIRLIPAIALILSSSLSRFPRFFEIFGWTMLITSLLLNLVPRKTHHSFSMKSADILKPIYFRMISPFAFVLGLFIIFNMLR